MFTLEELDAILAWKLHETQHWLDVARETIAALPADYVSDLIARAIAADDDLAAYLLLADIKGIRHGIASAILMTALPDRYTVYDERAKASLSAIGLL